MRKTEVFGACPVANLVTVCGGLVGLFSVVKNTLLATVYKNWVYTDLYALLTHTFIHLQKLNFLSVRELVIPTIHTTYYKLQLFKLNYLLLIAGGSK